MTETEEVNWGYNCLTAGIHHGRPEKIWNLPLFQAAYMYPKDELALLVLTRIHKDALQITLHNEEFTTEWANRVRAYAEEHYMRTLQQKVGEIATYYKSPEFQRDVKDVVERVQRDKLNPHYDPRHGHDSINMLCRILGTKSSRAVS